MKHDSVGSLSSDPLVAESRASRKLPDRSDGSFWFAHATPLVRWFVAAKLLIFTIVRTDRRGLYGPEFLVATEGNAFERSLLAFRATSAGQDLLRRRPSWWETLSERSMLQACPPDSLGRRFFEHMRSFDLDERYPLTASRALTEPIEDEAERAWLRAWIDSAHDLRHVITGYGTDNWGEVCLQCFRYGQTRHAGSLLLSLFGLPIVRFTRRGRVLRSWLEAYRRGRDAKLLDLLIWENAFDQPLSKVRAAMGLHPIKHYPSLVAPEAYVCFASEAHCESPAKAMAVDAV
jgi:ubiquinone biosynthesis protein COQ4